MCDYTQIETLFKTMNNVYSFHHAISFRYCSVHSSQIRADYPINLAVSAVMLNFATSNRYDYEIGNTNALNEAFELGQHI